MLSIVQRLAAIALARLQQQRIPREPIVAGSALSIPWRWSIPPHSECIAMSIPQLIDPT